MRIKTITTAVVEANYDWTIVRVEGEDGLCGWGEAFCAPGLPETIRELAPLIEGRDARHVEALVRRLHLATAHVSGGGTVYHAISGIEAALWDLSARAAGVPLWQLFGGCFRDRVRIYADCHAGAALTSYGATLVSRHLPWMGEPDLSGTDEAEVHWAPAEAGDVFTREAYAARALEMAGRGFTALKFDLDLPLLANEDLYARTISGQQLERQVAIATAAIEAERTLPSTSIGAIRRRTRCGSHTRWRGCQSSGWKTRRLLGTSPPSHASRSGRRRRSARARTSTGSKASQPSWPQAAWTSSLPTSRRSEVFPRRS
jgi:gluconate/galactonate dehydratase